MQFLFTIPKFAPGLSHLAKDVLVMASLSERLVSEKRTRVAHIDGTPENVAEHSLMLVKVSVAIARKYYPQLDAGKVAQYAACHDDVEAYVGDTPTGEWANTDYVAKKELEDEGLKQLSRDFRPLFPDYVDQVVEYEKQVDAESRFVRMMDKVVCNAIQVTNEGKEVRKNFTPESYISNEKHRHSKHKDSYTDWIEVLDLIPEIAEYITSNLFTTKR